MIAYESFICFRKTAHIQIHLHKFTNSSSRQDSELRPSFGFLHHEDHLDTVPNTFAIDHGNLLCSRGANATHSGFEDEPGLEKCSENEDRQKYGFPSASLQALIDVYKIVSYERTRL